MSRYENLLLYMPLYYRDSGIVNALLSVEGKEFDILRENIDDVKNQFFIDTATWGLELWEKEYGLPVNTEFTDQQRRSRLKGKIRGVGKSDATLIKTLAEAYSNGEVDVSFEDGTIGVKFVGIRGIPDILEVLKGQINDIVPAHLEVVYIFSYLTWKEFDLLSASVQESMTWDQLEVYSPV